MFHTPLLGALGGQEVLFILVAVLLLFGGKKIPELMGGLGKGIREFKDGKDGVESEEQSSGASTSRKPL